MDPRSVKASTTVLVHWMSVVDTNNAGFVHGGTVLKLCDEAAGIAAIRHSSRRVVTAGLDRVTFVEPIEQGDLVTLTASVNAVWRTSMEVGVRVTAERPRGANTAPRHTNTAYFTMVALDDDGRPSPVPPLRSESEDEQRREREAQVRRRNRLTEREELLRHRQAAGER
jgi:acyl-CoA hydrolase